MYLKNYEQFCNVISRNKKLSFSLKDFFFFFKKKTALPRYNLKTTELMHLRDTVQYIFELCD